MSSSGSASVGLGGTMFSSSSRMKFAGTRPPVVVNPKSCGSSGCASLTIVISAGAGSFSDGQGTFSPAARLIVAVGGARTCEPALHVKFWSTQPAVLFSLTEYEPGGRLLKAVRSGPTTPLSVRLNVAGARPVVVN